MIVFQSSATAIVPQGQVTIAQCFSSGTRGRKHISPEGTAETLTRLANFRLRAFPADPPLTFTREISVYQLAAPKPGEGGRPLAVEKSIFAKRTQIENHKTLPISRMRKQDLASFSKRTHFLFAVLVVQSSSIKPAQAWSRLFKLIQPYSRHFLKKDCLFFGLRALAVANLTGQIQNKWSGKLNKKFYDSQIGPLFAASPFRWSF